MIYLTAIWLTPGGSSTVHIYTQTIHRTTHYRRKTVRRTTHYRRKTVHRTTQFIWVVKSKELDGQGMWHV